jgi:ABC-type transport system substrate-binding protein
MNLDSSDTTGIRNWMLLLPPRFAYYFAAWHHLTSLPVSGNRMGLSRIKVGFLMGLAIQVIAGGLLGSLGLLTHFGVIGARSGAIAPTVALGGTWTYGLPGDAGSLILNGDLAGTASGIMDHALYLPLFYGDAQGVIYPVAATQVPTVLNGGVSAHATIWTFHMRPGLGGLEGNL